MPSMAIGILNVRIVPIPEPVVAVGVTTPWVTTMTFEIEFDASGVRVSETREIIKATADNTKGRYFD